MKYAIEYANKRLSRHKTAYSALKQLATLSQPVCKCTTPCKSVRQCMTKLVGGIAGSDKVVCKHTQYKLTRRVYAFVREAL